MEVAAFKQRLGANVIVNDTVLRMCNITKRFSGVTVLDKVDFNLKKGEVHVLIGENGAGKSTLMKILAGVYQRSEGEIYLQDDTGELKAVEIENPLAALEMGISMVFQEFNLMENMSVAENICIGYEPVKGGILDRKTMYENTKEQLRRVSLDNVSPQTIVGSLTVAQKQCVEIAKCLSHNAKIIILDEPTSSLSEKEVIALFALIRALKESGVSIVYISHRMEEIFEIGDRITVFRDGQMIDTVNVADTDENRLVNMIVGREFVADDLSEENHHKKEVMLEGKNISVGNFGAKLDFKAYKGEILGIFGLVGAGRTELARIIFGVDPIGEGSLYKKGERIKINSPSDAIKYNIGLVPEDRKLLGLVTKLNVRDNLTLAKLRDFSWIMPSREKEINMTQEYIERLSIATHGQTQLVERLSGGNQQKIVISKWLAMNLDVLILDEPTRGIDVGAKAEIYNVMRQLAREGMSIIMISSDLPEILRVSHRVLVMHDGEIKLEASAKELDQGSIMHAAIS
jgi:ribose transport system ATP-binding protein